MKPFLLYMFNMKKVKAYIKVYDELDIINGLVQLLSYLSLNGMPENGTPAIKFPINELEYETEDHQLICAYDLARKALLTLNFQENELDSFIYENKNFLIKIYEQSFDKIQYLVLEINPIMTIKQISKFKKEDWIK